MKDKHLYKDYYVKLQDYKNAYHINVNGRVNKRELMGGDEMIPYSGLFFFFVLLLVSIPAIILGLKGRKIKKYGMVINLLMILLLLGGSKIQSACLVSFYIGQLILIKGYLHLKQKHKSIWILRGMVILSILPLIMVKLSHYVIISPVGFLGISYVTFRSVQMLIEIYDDLIKEVNILDFTYFLFFFPTISSGPIDRSRRFMDDINRIPSKKEYQKCLQTGVWKIFNGVLYKFVIASLISTYWMNKIPNSHNFFDILNYMYAYSMYLFFDFAGYSLFAVGSSLLFGVNIPDNFNKPFLSKDIKDFWSRWHMSLSFWFRDFIYTRFVMTAMKKKWFKSRYTSSYIGFIITMGTMGIWHGTEWNFIIYGIYHAGLIIFTDYFQRKSSWYKKYKNNVIWNYSSIFVTFNLICFGFLIFSGYLFK